MKEHIRVKEEKNCGKINQEEEEDFDILIDEEVKESFGKELMMAHM